MLFFVHRTDFHSLLFNRHQLSEAQFWKRYFSSKLFHAHQASIRSSATQFVAKEDPIFDKYLEKDDDGGYPCHLTCYTACADSSHNLVLTVLKASNPEDHGQKPSACSLISLQRLKTTAKYVSVPLFPLHPNADRLNRRERRKISLCRPVARKARYP